MINIVYTKKNLLCLSSLTTLWYPSKILRSKMVRAWYIDEDTTNPQNEHHRSPPKFVTLEELYKNSGVEYYQINHESFHSDETLKALIKDRKTIHQVEVGDCTEDELKRYLFEHLHTDDELQLVLDGCAYFDIRDIFEEWVRVEVIPGDLLVIPAGCYYRFVLDNKNVFTGVKFLQNAVYQAHNRPADDMDCRKEYLKKLHNNGFQ